MHDDRKSPSALKLASPISIFDLKSHNQNETRRGVLGEPAKALEWR